MPAFLIPLLQLLSPIIDSIIHTLIVDVLFAPTKETVDEARHADNPGYYTYAQPL
jgi:hypothetical protein